MGMYDDLRCRYPLPVAGANDREYQTKRRVNWETPEVSNEHQSGEPAALQLNDGLGVRQLDAQSPRVESGPTRFGDDWCGVFLRGDTAFYYAMTLRQVLHPNGEDVDAMTGALARIQLRGLLRILEASDERTNTPNVEVTGKHGAG